MRELLRQKTVDHWCHTLNHEMIERLFKKKEMKNIVGTHRSTLRKVYKDTCNWGRKKMDVSHFIYFLEQCEQAQARRHTRFAIYCARLKQPEKKMEELFPKVSHGPG